ncbi:TPA: type 1 fimbrial protein [Citrobacter werkmanii]
MKKLIIVCMLLLGWSSFSQASCRRDGSEGTITIIPPSQLVVDSHSYTAGEVLWDSGWVSTQKVSMEGCSRDYKVGFVYEPGSAQASQSAIGTANDGNSTAVFASGIQGVGIAIKTQTNAGPYDNVMSIDNSYHNGDGDRDHDANSPSYDVELVALGGPITSGNASFASPIARVSFRDEATEDSGGDVLTQLYLGNTQIKMKAMGCNVDTSSLSLPIGNVSDNSFDTSLVAGSAEQDLHLTCETGTAVSVSLNATPATGNNPDNTVIALSNPDSSSSATGVGVMLGIKIADAGFDMGALPINQTINIFTHTITGNGDGGQTVTGGTTDDTTNLQITARYFKTGSVVTGGQANATATLNFTYN